MAKVFAWWILGGSLLFALVVTWQAGMALSHFGRWKNFAHVAGILVLGNFGPELLIAAACNTLVMVTERRASSAMVQPVRQVPWWIAGFLGLIAPIAMALIFGLSLMSIAYSREFWAVSWKGIQMAFQLGHFGASVLSVVITAALLVALGPYIMRILLNVHGWFILKCIVLMQVANVVLYPLLSVWNEIFLH